MSDWRHLGVILCLTLALGACGGSGGSSNDGGTGGQPGDGVDDPPDNGDDDAADRVFEITPGEDASEQALAAFIQAGPGDTIEFGCGFFSMDTGLALQNTENVTVTGCGMDGTVLSFAESDTAEGLLISNVRGITVEDLTVVDTPGDGVKIKSSDFVTYRNVRTMWSSSDQPVTAGNYADTISFGCPVGPTRTISGADQQFTYTPDSDNGRYGIYPVQSTNILLEGVESLGASDAGIYVGQSDDVIIRDSHALYNVAGFEIENTQRADMHGNTAECNTVGYIVYDLPDLSQYGFQARMYDNLARNNNFENFAAGGIVSQVPSGSGLITLAFDRIEVFDNTFEHHKTASVIVTSYELVGDDGDLRQDIYDEALHIHDNAFVNSGYNPPLPAPGDLQDVGGGDVSSLLPTLIRLKNLGVGADILWDGLYDDQDTDCAYPDGVPANDRGKPQYEGTGVQPECRYNAYKFDDAGQRKKPSMWLCIENNSHSGSPLAPDFANFHGLEGLEVLDLVTNPQGLLQDPQGQLSDLLGGLPNIFADRDVSPHQCAARFGQSLPPLPAVTLDEYEPSPGAEPPPTEAEVRELCNRDTGGAVNWEALARVDCPNLAQYHLFDNPDDPSAAPNGGIPYDLNTQLFSDYAVKYRFVYMPPGEAAQYRDGDDGPNATLVFPVGTVITKTFSFPDTSGAGPTIDHVETRLLIKRADADGTPYWAGLPYIWRDDAGDRSAELSLTGGEASVSWHYQDADTGELYDGSTDSYSIPNANQCSSCHANTHRTAGPAPIGPKPRNLNKPYPYPDAGQMNQLAYWQDNGLLTGAPTELDVDGSMIATSVDRLPKFDVPGDSGESPDSDPDVEARVRAYLETNCAHCHNDGGQASNTGLFLDALRAVDRSYGICKTPTAAGQGSGGRSHDIVPGSSADSILTYRMGNAGDIEVQMPPVARSVDHTQAKALVERWIDQVVDDSYPGATCDGGSGGLSGGS